MFPLGGKCGPPALPHSCQQPKFFSRCGPSALPHCGRAGNFFRCGPPALPHCCRAGNFFRCGPSALPRCCRAGHPHAPNERCLRTASLWLHMVAATGGAQPALQQRLACSAGTSRGGRAPPRTRGMHVHATSRTHSQCTSHHPAGQVAFAHGCHIC